MKVALFISDQSPQLGGGYTFEYQILAELIRSIPSSKHRFIIYTFNKSINEKEVKFELIKSHHKSSSQCDNQTLNSEY